ncbi:MAG: TonB-dependent receptor [Chitinophagaceae bacterium]
MKKLRWIPCLSYAFAMLFFILNSCPLMAQNPSNKEVIDIGGKIVDKLGQPIKEVQVVNRRTGKVVLTDDKGVYSIGAVQGDSLTASLVGYHSYDWVFKDRIVLDIVLEANEGSLGDVVVVGYGQQKKISLTGAQSSVDLEDIKQPVANLSASLAGRVAGLVGVQRSGLPGSNAADVWIRGIATFNGSAGNSASPLIIVDGVQGRDLNAFDPEDISSFTILKDAAATAVYGAQGANGVMIITTKKGKVGKTALMFNYNQGILAFTKLPKLASAEQYMRLRNEAEDATDGFSAEYTEAYIDSTLSPTGDRNVYPNVDWMDAIFKNTAMNRRMNFSARGGGEHAQFYTSLAYYEESSLLRTDALANYKSDTRFRRYNFTSNVDMDWTSTTHFQLGVQGYITNTSYPGVDPDDAFGDVMTATPVLFPTMYRDATGTYVPAINSDNSQPNPYAEITQTGYQDIFGNQLYTNATITQKLDFLLKGLSVHGTFSYDGYNTNTTARTRSRSTYTIDKSDPYNDDGTLNLTLLNSGSDALSYSYSNGGHKQFYMETGVNYDNTFGDHHVTGMVLFNRKSYTEHFSTTFLGSLPYRNQGIAGRATYGFRDRYFAEFDFAYNGSENFSPEHRYGFFPSISFGWVLSNEAFFKPLSNVFQFFKLRYSNGVIGDGSGGNRRFAYLTNITTGGKGITFLKDGTTSSTYSGVNVTDYGVDLTWAKSHKQDVGLEFKTFNNNLSVVVDYFNEHRTGVFLQRGSFPAYLGFQYTPYGNLGVINNRGFDGTLESGNIQWGQTTWNIRGTFSYNKDKVIENDEPTQEYPYLSKKGRNYLSDYGYVAEGLFQSQAEIDNHADQTTIGDPRVGDIKYKDLNGDGVINTYDMTRIGNGDVPNWVYGLGFNVTYRGFYFGVFFQGIHGADRQISGDGIIPFNNSNGAERSNLFAIAEDRWTEDNHAEHPFYPRLSYGSTSGGNANNNQTSTWWEKSIDFIRFKSADIGYNFPSNTFQHIGVKTARIYFQGVNLLYWSSFKLWDPELDTSNGTVYPNTRTFSVGIQANF